MKKLIYFVIIVAIFSACKKDKSGTVTYKLSFSDSQNKTMNKWYNQKSTAVDGDTLYTNLGHYITSITPSKFLASFIKIQFHDELGVEDHGHSLELVGPETVSQFSADFSNNATVEITPKLRGLTGVGYTFSDAAVDFTLLQSEIDTFYQEIVLPVEYTNVHLNQFDFTWNILHTTCNEVKNGNILKVNNWPIFNKMFKLDSTQLLTEYFFGRTNTTQLIADPDHIVMHQQLYPVHSCAFFFVWSNHYSTWTFNTPEAGETKTINTTISFNADNLLQVYAGADDIAYTSDDIIVYAPKFWERLFIKVE